MLCCIFFIAWKATFGRITDTFYLINQQILGLILVALYGKMNPIWGFCSRNKEEPTIYSSAPVYTYTPSTPVFSYTTSTPVFTYTPTTSPDDAKPRYINPFTPEFPFTTSTPMFSFITSTHVFSYTTSPVLLCSHLPQFPCALLYHKYSCFLLYCKYSCDLLYYKCSFVLL